MITTKKRDPWENNLEARLMLRNHAGHDVHSLGSWIACVGEEFLRCNFPHKKENWIAHQLEYMRWGTYWSGGNVEFRWQHGNRPLFPAEPDTDLTADDLLNIYEKTRDSWVALHIGAIRVAMQFLVKKDQAAVELHLPDQLVWLPKYLSGEYGGHTTTILGCNVRFKDPPMAVTAPEFGPHGVLIEFPKFTKGTLKLFPDVSREALRNE